MVTLIESGNIPKAQWVLADAIKRYISLEPDNKGNTVTAYDKKATEKVVNGLITEIERLRGDLHVLEIRNHRKEFTLDGLLEKHDGKRDRN